MLLDAILNAAADTAAVELRKVSRRGFLKALAAGGLLLALDAALAPLDALAAPGAPSTAHVPRATHDPLVWLAIAPSGIVTIVVARSEMGQGSRSTLALAIADELEADRAQVRLHQADGDEKRYGSQNTDGSRSIRMDLDNLRRAGAAARMMLEAAAAKAWGVPASEVEAVNHVVRHARSGKQAGYGALAAAAWKEAIPATIPLKPKSKLRYLGKENQPGFDLADMVTGRAVFGADMKLPGMLYAAIARPPVYGGAVTGYDEAAARAINGVKGLHQLPQGKLPGGFQPLGGVAVLATNTWSAIQGRDALAVRWDDGGNAKYDSETFRQGLEAEVNKPGSVAAQRGDVDAAFAKAYRRLKASYYVPHLIHAPMEPMAATAHYKADGTCEIWAPSQHPHAARETVAAALGIPVEKVTVHVTLLGGGFGRKSKPDFIAEAAILSRAAQAPVRIQWTREDEIRHGYYHTVSAQRLEASIDKQGQVTGWLHRTAFPTIASIFVPLINRPMDPELGMGVTDFPYAIPNRRAETGAANAHVRIGWFRAVANIQHGFAINSFLAEIAASTGRDHKDLVLELLGGAERAFEAPKWNYDGAAGKHPVDRDRLRGVVELVTSKAGWGKKLPIGHGRGLAVHRSFLSYVATVIAVAVDADGNLTIPRVDMAIDCGFVASPDRVRAQLEGSVIMGLSSALYGAVTFKDGKAEQSNFHDYPVMRMDAAPKAIHSWLVDSDHPSGGVGEPGIPPVAPALTNAIHAAIGKRIRTLPVAEQLKPRA